MTGSAMNTAAAIGKPVAMGGLALAGMDPIGLGLRAGMVGMRAGGIAAGVGAGAATGGLALAGLGAAQYAGTQMFRGAQQQQVLGAQLNSTFRFANQYGGRGFGGGELRDIGQMMRQMSGQRGPGGEFATMDELGRLAANMGRMGMAQGVRNAKDFREKFQQMMRTVKDVATQLSTSLEEAQKAMSSMQGSGIFGAAKQGAAAKQMRLGVVAGGRTMEEMAQAASIGSQIVRAGGGRGDAGARAMMKAVTNIGAAVKSGVLTEEDIYNQTGQYGAAGVQAMAASNLQQDMSFLKGNKGRYLLAGLAGKDGRLDQSSLRRFMRGDMSTGEVQQRGQLNLSKVGRANFIRYEGALRGEVTAALGGMGGAMAMRGWLEQRGMNLGQMDDRSMLMYQRQMGVDRETADNQIKMLKNMPRILEQQGQSMEEDSFMRKVEQSERHKGIQGIKRKLEDARKNINDKLQQVGADFYSEGTNLVEGFINRITGRYVATIDRDLTKTVHDVMRGGDVGKEAAATRLGITSKGHRGLALTKGPLGTMAQARIFGRPGDTGALAENYASFMVNNAKEFQKAGWDLMSDSGMRAEETRMGSAARGGTVRRAGQTLPSRLNRFQAIAAAGMETDEAALAAGAGKFKQKLLSAVVRGGAAMGGGEAGVNNFESVLQDLTKAGPNGVVDQDAVALLHRYSSASSEEQARIRGSLLAGAGANRPEIAVPEGVGRFDSGRFSTIEDRHRAIGEYALKGVDLGKDTAVTNAMAKAVVTTNTMRRGFLEGVGSGLGATGIGRAVAGLSAKTGVGKGFWGINLSSTGAGQAVSVLAAGAAGARQTLANLMSDKPTRNLRAVNAAFGRLADSEEGRRMSEMVLSRDEATRDAAMQQLARNQQELDKGRSLEELSDAERAQHEFNRALMTTAKVNAAVEKAGGIDKLKDSQWEELMRESGAKTKDEVLALTGSIVGTAKQKQDEATEQYGARAGEIARQRLTTARELGTVSGTELSKEFREKLSKVGKKVDVTSRVAGKEEETVQKSMGELAMESLLRADKARAAMSGGAGSAERTAALERQAMAEQDLFEQQYGQLDTASRKAFQERLRETGRDAEADRLEEKEAINTRLSKGLQKGWDSKSGKQAKGYTETSFYGTVGKELGIKVDTGKPGELRAQGATEADVYRQLTGGNEEVAGADAATIKKLVADLEKARVSGDKEGTAAALQGIQETGVQQRRDQAKQEEAAKQNDPSYRALMDIKGLLGKNLNVNVVNMPTEGLGAELPAGYGRGNGTRTASSE